MAGSKRTQRIEPLPGPVDHGNGWVGFSLYAPGKASVHLIGDFNGWNRQTDPLKSGLRGLWTIEKRLPVGTYRYQFLVDNQIVICDPYARAVEDHFDGRMQRAIIDLTQPAFAWQHDSWPRPKPADLIYDEIHVVDFTAEGTLAGVTERLDYLRDLGINAIELLPVFHFGHQEGWGYDPLYFFAVHAPYGSADDLRELVDQAHARGIAVILDVVLAHTAVRHPFAKLYPWAKSPWYGDTIGETNQFGLPKLDHTKKATQTFCRHVQEYWLREFHIDGYRYDYLPAVGHKNGDGLPRLCRDARDARPDVYLIGEYIAENTKLTNTCGLDAAWHVRFSQAAKTLMSEKQVMGYHWAEFDKAIHVIDPKDQGYQPAERMLNYIESHDEYRAAHDVRDMGIHNKQMLQWKLTLGAVLLLTAPGEPLLYHGQEWGEDTEKRTNKRNVLHWEQLASNTGRKLHDVYRRLIHLRRDHPALRSENLSIDLVNPRQKCLSFRRWEGDDHVVVAINFSPQNQKITLQFPFPGQWRETLANITLDVQRDQHVEMPPYSAKVLIRE